MRTTPNLSLLPYANGLEQDCAARSEGRVSKVVGLTIESTGPRVSVGDLAWVETHNGLDTKRVPAEVVGFRDNSVLLMPVEYIAGIRPGARVLPAGRLKVRAGYSLLGRVLDGLGRPIDELRHPEDTVSVDIDGVPPRPLKRKPLSESFSTGIKAIDGLITCAKGQRLGVFSGSGVGKSVLLGSLARNSCSTINVIALIGERGREVRDFIDNCLGPEGLAKSVIVTATSDESPLMRLKGAATATAIAEYFRDQGEDVLLLMDSVTRYSMAQREIGLAVGEPPTTKGYPPSVFGLLSRLLERSGTSAKGVITAFYTVLVEADDMNDPIADSVRAILDGHIVLSRELAEANRYPAIDVLSSISRLMNEVIDEPHKEMASKLRTLLSVYKKAEDLINVGAYVEGSNPKIDEALTKIDRIEQYLRQPQYDSSTFEETLLGLQEAVS
ncbi:hypothetical protein BVX97_01525 [bacterium E08(2017)]|nr:hypothetical protein BVX97_01525 [bacterium E08(2017)]